MREDLKYILDKVHELQKFAEAKNAGIIVFNSGFVIGSLSIITIIKSYITIEIFIIGYIILSLSVLLSFLSQFPKTQNIFFKSRKINNPNLQFFGHLAHLTEDDFITEISEVNDKGSLAKLDIDLINQILVNSRITLTKFNIAKASFILTLFGIGIITLSTLTNFLWPS